MKQVPYLEETSDDERFQMGELVRQLLNQENNQAADEARRKIMVYSRKIVPSLLNAFLKLDLAGDEDHRILGNMIADCLKAHNNNQGHGYNYGPGASTRGLEDARKKWFQWWAQQTK